MKQHRKISIWEALAKVFKEFCANTSIGGYKYLITERSGLRRSYWWFIEILSLSVVAYLVQYTWYEFLTNPTVTTLDTPTYPIGEVPFPGISICDINKINKRKALEFVKPLSKRTGVPEDVLLERMRHLGKLYDYKGTLQHETELIELQSFLDTFVSDNKTHSFDAAYVMRKLLVPCEELLSDCSWDGKKFACSELFTTDYTMEGHCCMFNYLSRLSSASVSPILKSNGHKILSQTASGVEMGLTVRVYSSEEDYMYPLLPTVGINVHIFNSQDFPDTYSGNLQERIVPMGAEVFIRLYATTVYTTDAVRSYSVKDRHCLFEDEVKTLFGRYSFSDCFVDCRIKSINALCNCVPFHYMLNYTETEQYITCTLSDLACLYRFQDKWRNIYPIDYTGNELELEKEHSLFCPTCVPACSDTLYTVRNDALNLVNTNNEVLNYSTVHVFFDKLYTELYRQDVRFYWYDIVSIFGGVLGLFIGVSLISAVEVVYFFTYRFYVILRRG